MSTSGNHGVTQVAEADRALEPGVTTKEFVVVALLIETEGCVLVRQRKSVVHRIEEAVLVLFDW